MRKLKALIFTVFLSCVAPGILYADISGTCGDDLHFTLDNSGILTITGEGRMKEYSRSSLPWRPELVNEVNLPDGLVNICNDAFSGSRIKMVDIPSSVREIGRSAFANCKRLSAVSLPYGLLGIGDKSFKDCISLVNVRIPASVKSIGSEAFSGCSMITSIGIPSGTMAVGKGAFKGCRFLADVTSLPDFITEGNCSEFGILASLVVKYRESKLESGVIADVTEISSDAVSKKEGSPQVASGVEYGQSDVDKNIPVSGMTNSNLFAFIIANESYDVMPDVPFAVNDGKTFAAYCQATLGVPQSNINTYFNATYGNIRAAVEYMKQIDDIYKDEASFIFYYAGHGAPDDKTAGAYLLPTDAYAINDAVCYPLDTLYKELGELESGSVKVFMDACFSGVDRGNEMLAQGGRLVAIAPKKGNVSGNVVVVSATSNDQAAWHFAPQGHGLFTYCLVKKLQESGGNVTMGELCDYLQTEVPKLSIVQNRTVQTPTAQPSRRLGSKWRSWQINQ